jgi:hypothetical protein
MNNKNCNQCTTVVVFRVFKDSGSVVALFPHLSWNPEKGTCTSYDHAGHGAADYTHCVQITHPAAPHEYAPLKRELESIGYVLDVKKRKPKRCV